MKHALILLAALIAQPVYAGVLVPKGAPTKSLTATISKAAGTVQQVNPPKEAPPAKPDYSKTSLGINVNSRSTSGANRVATNLVSSGKILRTVSTYVAMPADRMDANGDAIKLEPNERYSRVIMTPTAVFQGAKSVDVTCRWDGRGTAEVWGTPPKNAKVSANSLTFTFAASGLAGANIQFKNIDPANPVRDVDCRETGTDPKAVWNPAYIANLSRYSTVRFIKWQTAVEANTPVTWADRSRPGIPGSDGVSIEEMVQLANAAKVNPWFCMPWNADDDYIRRFAEYVRDNLDPSLTAYIETANEVWNSGYPVNWQAIKEGVAEGLYPSDKYVAGTLRYAERATEIADIWAAVFKGKPNRLVRVLAFQQSVYSIGKALAFRDTPKHFDVVATAPYFAASPAPGSVSDVDAWIASTLIPQVDRAIDTAKLTKAAAAKYGLRYVTYEAGQHVNSPNDVPLLTAINRSPAMGLAYQRYLSRWQAEVGDLMVLFADYGTIGKYGSWGLSEYIGQPLSDAPKARAVDAFMRTSLKGASK